MTTMIRQQLLAAPAWTQITVDDIVEILLTGPSGGYEVSIGLMAPGVNDSGMPVTANEGSFRWTGFAADEAVFARPFGAFQNQQPTLNGMSSAPTP